MLHGALVSEQGHVCCYCESRISVTDSLYGQSQQDAAIKELGLAIKYAKLGMSDLFGDGWPGDFTAADQTDYSALLRQRA